MTNVDPQKALIQHTQDDRRVESQKEDVSEESTAQGSNTSKKALSKREIMEQLSRERFPWDE